MAFIRNDTYRKIVELAKNGDERAKALIDHYTRKDYADQSDLDRMVFNVFNPEPEEEAPKADEDEDLDLEFEEEEVIPDNQPIETEDGVVAQPAVIAESYDSIDADMDGLVDKTEIEDLTFEDFLGNKTRDANRAKKNHDYFLMYDADAREDYLNKKKDEYSHSFDTMRGDIDRSYRDMDKALCDYALGVGDLEDDSVDLDEGSTASAYGDILERSKKSHAFGRSWDVTDKEEVMKGLLELVAKYGRKNVLGALNILKGDNQAYRDFRNGKIDAAVGKYGKALDDILK